MGTQTLDTGRISFAGDMFPDAADGWMWAVGGRGHGGCRGVAADTGINGPAAAAARRVAACTREGGRAWLSAGLAV